MAERPRIMTAREPSKTRGRFADARRNVNGGAMPRRCSENSCAACGAVGTFSGQVTGEMIYGRVQGRADRRVGVSLHVHGRPHLGGLGRTDRSVARAWVATNNRTRYPLWCRVYFARSGLKETAPP